MMHGQQNVKFYMKLVTLTYKSSWWEISSLLCNPWVHYSHHYNVYWDKEIQVTPSNQYLYIIWDYPHI